MLDIDLATEEGRGLLAALDRAHGGPIAAAASRLQSLFLLRSPWAPGLRFAGGLASASGTADDGTETVTRFSSAGTGLTIPDALASCIGETVERLSQVERPGDVAVEAPVSEVAGRLPAAVRSRIEALAAGTTSTEASVAWVTACNGLTGAESRVPADWCLRRTSPGPLHVPGSALSTGVAAGATFDAAALRAVLELVERDAASLWWTGGRRGALLPLEGKASRTATQLIDDLRQGGLERRSWLLDITTDLHVPVYAALSTDRNGKRLACGLAARLEPENAVRAAILEMTQMEVGLLVAETKLAGAPGATMHASEQALVARARGLDARACLLLHPCGLRDVAVLADQSTVADRLRVLLAHLATQGIEVELVDLTRADLAIPVVAAIAPTLQLMPGDVMTERLSRVIAATGGGAAHTGGHSLY